MPRFAIHFRILLRAGDADKAQRTLAKAVRLLDRAAEATVFGRHHKDERLSDCTIRANLTGATRPEIAWDALILAGRLGSGWFITGPGPDGRLDLFEGVCDARRSGNLALSLEWASFGLIPVDAQIKPRPAG